MLHLPLSVMHRLNQTESAVFKLCLLYFQRISFSDYFEHSVTLVTFRHKPRDAEQLSRVTEFSISTEQPL